VRTQKNSETYPARVALSILAGWTPGHRRLEAGTAGLASMAGRGSAVRVAFARKAGSANHG
jgi:hypothetical protein